MCNTHLDQRVAVLCVVQVQSQHLLLSCNMASIAISPATSHFVQLPLPYQFEIGSRLLLQGHIVLKMFLHVTPVMHRFCKMHARYCSQFCEFFCYAQKFQNLLRAFLYKDRRWKRTDILREETFGSLAEQKIDIQVQKQCFNLQPLIMVSYFSQASWLFAQESFMPNQRKE